MPDKNWVKAVMPMGKLPLALLPPPSPEKKPKQPNKQESNKMHASQLHKQTGALLALLWIPGTVRAGKTENFSYLEVAENKQTVTKELLFALLKVSH